MQHIYSCPAYPLSKAGRPEFAISLGAFPADRIEEVLSQVRALGNKLPDAIPTDYYFIR